MPRPSLMAPRDDDGSRPRVRDVRRRADDHAQGGRRREDVLLLLDDLHGDIPRAREGDEEAPVPRPFQFRSRRSDVPPFPCDGAPLGAGRVDGPAHRSRLPPSDAGPVLARPEVLPRDGGRNQEPQREHGPPHRARDDRSVGLQHRRPDRPSARNPEHRPVHVL